MTQPTESSSGRVIVAIALVTIGLGVAAGTALVYVAKSNRTNLEARAVVVEPEPEPPVPVDAPPAIDPDALAARADGLEALYDERYDEAIRNLVRSAAARNPPPDADDLLNLARRLRRRAELEREERDPPEPAPIRPAPPPPSSTKIRRREAREDSRPAWGQLLVVTRPPGLTVYVDGDPRDITPAKIRVTAGSHRVRVRLGQRELLQRTVRVRSGEVEAVDADLTEKFNQPPPLAAEPIAASRTTPALPRATLENDESLDLVELIAPKTATNKEPVDDRQLDLVELIERDGIEGQPAADAAVDEPTNADLVARAPSTDKAPVAPDSAAGDARRIFVLAPAGINAGGLQRGLRRHLAGVEVRLFSSRAELKAEASKTQPDAVLASPSMLKSIGWAARLSAIQPSEGRNMHLVSVGDPLARARWAEATIGVVSAKPRNDAARAAQATLRLSKTPKIRKVSKADDLLPLLQFRMVDAVLVDSSALPRLKKRTKLALSTQEVTGSRGGEALAAGFSDAASRSEIERQLLGLNESAREEMGTGKWVIQ